MRVALSLLDEGATDRPTAAACRGRRKDAKTQGLSCVNHRPEIAGSCSPFLVPKEKKLSPVNWTLSPSARGSVLRLGDRESRQAEILPLLSATPEEGPILLAGPSAAGKKNKKNKKRGRLPRLAAFPYLCRLSFFCFSLLRRSSRRREACLQIGHWIYVGFQQLTCPSLSYSRSSSAIRVLVQPSHSRIDAASIITITMTLVRAGWSSLLLLLLILAFMPGKVAAFGAGNIPSIAQVEGHNWRHGGKLRSHHFIRVLPSWRPANNCAPLSRH